MSIHSAPTTTSFLDVLFVVVVVRNDCWWWSHRPPGRRLVAFSACASCLAMSRLTCPRRADALVVLFFFPLLLFVKLLLFVLKEGVVAWWSCWLVVVSSPPPSRWPWRRRSVLPRRLLSESRRPTERNVVVISHTTNAGRDSYLKRHRIIISSVQKGEIIITLLYNWSWCFAKARSSFLSKKKFRVGKSSLSIYSVYIYI